ncbi:MAG: TolC family protein [Alistipes sp.]|jgi:outer membrane protein TolC|nr:TolC family protein [Alistipes sp.]
MMKRILGKMTLAAVATLFAATAATTATAQDGGETLTLDLPTALEIALSENPTIKVADMEIDRFDYVRRETVGSHLPSLSAAGQYTFNIVKQEMAKGMSFGADMGATATADLSIPLLVPAVYAGLKMNRIQQELAVEQARSSRIDLVNAVTKAFYQTLLLEKSYEVLRESEATIQATVDNTRTMYEAGLASEYDLLTAEVQLSNLQPSIIAARNGIEVARQMLRMYLSVPEDVAIALDGSLDDLRGDVMAMPDPTVDVDDNSEMRQLDYQQSMLRQQIRLTNAGRFPVLAAYGSLIFTGQDKTTGFGMGPGGEMAIVEQSKWWWQHPLSAGLQLSVPIFSGLKNHNKVKQLRNQVAQVDLQREYLRDAKMLEARTSVNNLLTARETMLAAEKTVAQAEKAYGISRTRFDAGAGTMLEVNQAQLNVTQSRLNHSQAIYDYLAAKADYDKITGKNN